MNMDQNSFSPPEQPQQSPKSSRKKYIIIAIISTVVLIGIAVALAVLLKINSTPQSAQKDQAIDQVASKEFKIQNVGAPINYAGSKVYDACQFISYDTMRKTVENYQAQLDTIGTGQRPVEPLVIEHRFVDRDIASPLGKDGQARQKSTTINGDGKVDADNFISTADSNCWYGQGEDIAFGGSGKTFAKVYVSQPPTPISQEFQGYITNLTKTASESGTDMYVSPGLDSAKFATVLYVNQSKNTVVLLKAGTPALVEAMTTDIVAALRADPQGPLTVEYPAPWNGLKNPCSLLSAEDFEKFTSKTASALAEDSVTLTTLDGGLMQRSCARLEVERTDGTEISESQVTVRMARDAKAAEDYTKHVKNDDTDSVKVEPIKQTIQGTDEVYVRALGASTIRAYELEMRIGAAIVSVNVETDAGLDTSVDAYAQRMLPVATSVLAKLNK